MVNKSIWFRKEAVRWEYFRDEMDESEKLKMLAAGADHYDEIIDASIQKILQQEKNAN